MKQVDNRLFCACKRTCLMSVLAILLCSFCIHPAQAITIKSAGLSLEYENQNVTQFMNEHPEISLVTTNWDYFTTLELTTKLTTGTMDGDFYILQGDSGHPPIAADWLCSCWPDDVHHEAHHGTGADLYGLDS